MITYDSQELHPYECWFCHGKMNNEDCARTEDENYQEYKKSHK